MDAFDVGHAGRQRPVERVRPVGWDPHGRHPVGAGERVRRVLVVLQGRRAVGRRDEQQPGGEHHQDGRREDDAGGSPEPPARQVRREPSGAPDPPVERTESPRQHADDQEGCAEDHERRPEEQERVDRSLAGGGGRQRFPVAELRECEQSHRQDDELDGGSGQRGARLPGRLSSLGDDRSTDRRDRRQPEHERTRSGRRRAEQDRAQRDGDGEPRLPRPRTVRETCEAGEQGADRDADREGERRGEQRLEPLCQEQRPRREPTRVQDGELERLPGDEQHPDAREHDEGDHEDLQEDEQDRHPKIGDRTLNPRDQDLDPAGDVRGLLLDDQPVVDVGREPHVGARQVQGIRIRDAGEREVEIPREVGRQAEFGRERPCRRPIDEHRNGVHGIALRERCVLPEPERVRSSGWIEDP